jgi:hypothetical protein
MNIDARNQAHPRRLALAVLATLLLALLWLPLELGAQAPAIDFGQPPPQWSESGYGYWTRSNEYLPTGRIGYIARLTSGEMVDYQGGETIQTDASLIVDSGSGEVLAGFGGRMTERIQCEPLKDDRPVVPQVKVTEGQFHGYPATVVEGYCRYPSYAYPIVTCDLAGNCAPDTSSGVQENWEGGYTYLARLTCFETTPGGPCTLVQEGITAWTEGPAALGENAEQAGFETLVAEVDDWKTRWSITGAGPPEPSPTPERKLTVVGYDGTDTVHMPLTFAIKAEENGKPLANERIGFRFLGDVKCLADEYATWDVGSQRWQPVNQNLAVDQTLQAVTNADGELVLRTVLDFGRMRLFDKKLPCTIELHTAMAAKPGEYDTLIEQRFPVTIRHPVFIRDVFFWAAKDPMGKSRWIRTSVLNNMPYDQYVDMEYGRRLDAQGKYPFAAYPGSWDVLSRVHIAAPGSSDYTKFEPPSTKTDYFYPLTGGSKVLISLHDDLHCGECGAFMQPGDGIAVAVMWADGMHGLIAQRNESVKAVYVTFGDGSHYGAQTSEESEWTRFAVSQGADFLIKGGLVLGATWIGGPVAGAWTAMIIEVYQSVSDVSELAQLGSSKKMIVFRSEASLTDNPDETMTLYNFAGSPSVMDDTGNEVFAGVGEAIDFAYDGPIQPAVAQRAPPAALEMQVVLSQESGPYGGAVDYPLDDAVPASPGGAVDYPPEVVSIPPDDLSLPLLFCGGLGSILVIGTVVVIGTRSRKKGRALPPGPNPVSAPGPAPVQTQRPPAPAVSCPHCGQAVKPGIRFCKACGGSLASASPPSRHRASPQPAQGAAGWQLLVVSGPGAGQRYPLGPKTSLGRSRDNSIQLEDTQSSRDHALFQQTSGGYVVQDLGSTNGTLVNGQRIRQAVAVKPGDRLQIGNTVLQVIGPVRAEPTAAGPTCPHCGQPVGDGVRFCRHCGQTLP